MPRQRIIIAVPTYESIDPACFKSIYDLETPEGCDVEFNFVCGYDCARARNLIAQQTLSGRYDYVFMVDSDMVLPQKALTLLLAADKDIILGWYPRRRDMAGRTELFALSESIDFDDDCNMNISKMPLNEVVEVKGGGLGCALVKADVFRKIGSGRWFQYVEYTNGSVLSEDLFFCHNSRTTHGFKIYAHTSVRCGHVCKYVQ